MRPLLFSPRHLSIALTARVPLTCLPPKLAFWDRLQDHTSDRKCLELARIGQLNTTICEWDIERATQDRYKADRAVLTDFYHAADGQPRDVVQKIRPVLET